MFLRSWRVSALLRGLWVSLVLLATSAPAQAQATPEDPLLTQAEQLATRGDHVAALALLRVVVGRAPSPRALGLLGLSALRQGEPVDAEAAVQRALTTPSDAWVAAHRRELNAALTETARQLGTVIVEGVPDGTAVRIAGRDIGAAPLAPTRVRAGDVVVEAGAARVTISVAAGATVTATPSAASATTTPTAVVAPVSPTTPATGGESVPAVATIAVPSVVFGGAAADARIPATFTMAFPVRGASSTHEASTWTHRFRLNLGFGAGAMRFLDRIWRQTVPDAYGQEFLDFDSSRSFYFAFAASGTLVYGLSMRVQLFARLDVAFVPGSLNFAGDYRPRWDTSSGGPVAGSRAPALYVGAGSLIAPVLTPGIRWRPMEGGVLFISIGARLGFAVALASVDVWQCADSESICSYYPWSGFSHAAGSRPSSSPDVTSSASSVTLLYGGELGIGASLGTDIDWDLGLRVSLDNNAFSGLITLDRRLL